MTASDWKKFGKYVTINDSELFVIDTDPLGRKEETLVILHGYPLNSYDYHEIIPILSEFYRVVTHDHIGFGFSENPNKNSYSLIDQANTCIELWGKLKLKDFKILATEYGAMISKEIVYQKNANLIPFNIQSIIISQNNSKTLYENLKAIDYLFKNKHLPKYREVLANYNNKEEFNKLEEGPENIKYRDDRKILSIWKNFNTKEKQKDILVLSNYTEEVFLYWHRWMSALKNTNIPITIFWRKDDFVNMNEILLHMATFYKDNIKTVENKNCFVIEENPKNWTLMILEQLDKVTHHSAKQEYFVC